MHRRGLTRVLSVERSLDDVNEAVERVLDGSAPAPRLVFRMDAGASGPSRAEHAVAPA